MIKTKSFWILLFCFFSIFKIGAMNMDLSKSIWSNPPTEVLGKGKAKVVHEALFYTFFPRKEFTGNSEVLLLAGKRSNFLFNKFYEMDDVKIIFQLFRNVRLLTSSVLLKAIYKFITKEELELEKYDKKYAVPLINFLKSVRRGRGPIIGIWELSEPQRRKFIQILMSSELNFHRRIGFGLRNLYISNTYKGKLGIAVSGVDYDDDARSRRSHRVPQLNSHLTYDSKNKEIKGELDYIVIGSGLAGSVVAHQLQQAGKKVLILEKGPFVLPGTNRTYLNFEFFDSKGPVADNDASIYFMNSSIVGGGSSINNGFAFSPLLPYVRERFEKWRAYWKRSFFPFNDLWNYKEMENAYAWVRKVFKPRLVPEEELNENNLILMNGLYEHKGVKAQRYELNRRPKGRGKSDVYDMISTLDALLMKEMIASSNPLSLLPDAKVLKVLFEEKENVKKAYGVEFEVGARRNRSGIIYDPYKWNIPVGTKVSVRAKKVILSAGNLGTTIILKSSGLENHNIGKGFVTHPYIPILGVFDREINALEGELASVYTDYYRKKKNKGLENNFLLEVSVTGPDNAATLIPGRPIDALRNFENGKNVGGFGVILIDEAHPRNRIEVKKGKPTIYYDLSQDDKKRMIYGLSEGARILFKAGAKEVFALTYENFKKLRNYKMGKKDLTLTSIEQVDKFEKNLKLIPNKTFLMGAHMAGANKIGVDPSFSVLNLNHEVWGTKGLYVVDASVFPESVGANPMQTIYAMAKIFADRHLKLKK